MASIACRQGAVQSTGQLVRAVVADHRAAGCKAGHAMEEAARQLGITQRRVRAYCYGEVVAVMAEEYLAVRTRFAAHLDREERRLHAACDALRAKRAALGLDP